MQNSNIKQNITLAQAILLLENKTFYHTYKRFKESNVVFGLDMQSEAVGSLLLEYENDLKIGGEYSIKMNHALLVETRREYIFIETDPNRLKTLLEMLSENTD